MIQTASVAPEIACAEAIAFMHLLDTIPTEPSIRPRQQQAHINPSAYSLSFDRERDLVNTLAILSSIGEDPKHVPALCMHEKLGTNESGVIIAVNQARFGDGFSALNDIKGGFDSIFHSLSKVLQSEHTSSQPPVIAI